MVIASFTWDVALMYRFEMDNQYQLVLSNCPDPESATLIAEALVTKGLAACVNIVPGIKSLYMWQGALENTREQLLIIKTKPECYHAIQTTICSMHPYELPEVIAVSINEGLPAYLRWIENAVKDSIGKNNPDS